MAKATAAASRAITVALEMVLPGVLGLWIDEQFGTRILFMVLGFIFGLTFAIWHLLKMTKPDRPQNSGESQSEDNAPRTGRGGTAS